MKETTIKEHPILFSTEMVKVANRILSETPPEVKEFVKKQCEELVRRHREIEATDLTDEEIRRAIWSAKITKWNKERNKEYWEKLENEKCQSTIQNITRSGR